MAYVPPHKRHSCSPSFPPDSSQPRFNKYPNKHDTKKDEEKGHTKIIYANNAVSLWFPVGLADNSQLSSKTHLQPFASDPKARQNPLVLVLNDPHLIIDGEASIQHPWDFIAENVQPELLSAFGRVKNWKMENESEEIIPTLVARFGEILFQGGQSDYGGTSLTNLAQLRKTFHTNVSSSYMDYMINEVVSKLGLHFEQEQDVYHIKLSDNKRPESTLSCKCMLKDHGRLELLKVELNQVRHLVADMSCLVKDLDLRLMLCTKRIMKTFTDNEIENIRLLIGYAIPDPKVKGGLRWPLGKDSSGDRYTVCGVWHIPAKIYKSSSMRLKVRQADRFDFRSSKGKNSVEVNLKLHGIVSLLQEPTLQTELVSQMLKDNLRLIWENCLDRSASASMLT